MRVGINDCAHLLSSVSSEAASLICCSAAGCCQSDHHGDAGVSEDPHVAQQSARPKSKYTLAGFIGFWASFFAAADVSRPSSAELQGRQPGQDGARVVNCTLDTATGMRMHCETHSYHGLHAPDAEHDAVGRSFRS